ncbi:FAD-dependent thymidylate synthase [Mycobacterium tuberculosis]|uniref:ThyX-like thymidylate synthase n=1 Tax=Mycobacterium phage Fred313 TaxID=2015809 RepID=A0A286MPY2_9CAUD|nr:FAD-dependent thymidylate synthase [Mycobacterium tuberculosis]ASW31307.1 ThyX-like thymidylate synthase [Mycobacterium phage Fred313]MBP2972710.1 FAD-dependent thymidylate synthase [Mycobacterium tuberculosis]QTR25196.1 FAD-dependent thymidylate synthase [Mycobacterium tuberculosis]QTR25198.1 FAD-dependent thymidylate synthase [Mycobacterium tuberculosis]
MKVKLIAATDIDVDALQEIGYEPHGYVEPDDEPYFGDYAADELAEFAGRNCYRSFHRPNPMTEQNEAYLNHILDVGHESVLEHASATFYIEASRSVLTELERHRHLSFSVVSQRYVDPVPLGFHIPPAIEELDGDKQRLAFQHMRNAVEESIKSYDRLVELYKDAGLPRKKAREAARAVLPNMTNSPMVVTGNHRAWRYVIKARWHEAADAEIRDLAGELLRQLREIAPNTYQDIPDTPYSY